MTAQQKRYEWLLVAIMFSVWGTLFLDRMSLLYLAPYIAPDLHISGSQVSMLAAVISVTWAISSLAFGALSDKIGRRKVLIPMIFAFSIMSCLSGLAQNFQQLLLARALMGIAEGPCWSVMNAIIERSSSPETRNRNVNYVISGASLVGIGLAPVLTTQIAAHFGWRPAFFLAGLPGFVLGALTILFVKEPLKTVEAGIHDETLHMSSVRLLLKNRNVLLCSVGSAGFIAWLILQNAFAPLYITQVLGKPATEAGFLLSIAGLGSFCVAFVSPSLIQRVGRRGALGLFAVLAALAPIVLLTPAFYSTPWLQAAILFCTQGGQAITALTIVLIPTLSVPPRLVGSAIGFCTMVGEIVGSTLVPIFVGGLLPSFGLGFPLEVAAGAMLMVAAAACFIRERPAFSHGKLEAA